MRQEKGPEDRRGVRDHLQILRGRRPGKDLSQGRTNESLWSIAVPCRAAKRNATAVLAPTSNLERKAAGNSATADASARTARHAAAPPGIRGCRYRSRTLCSWDFTRCPCDSVMCRSALIDEIQRPRITRVVAGSVSVLSSM
ncbi:hypothetical protein IBTHAUMO2_100002 [Nitrosopumilaceae archaeon]|nr:hypothetical protein IBTHAUMO2_100002 [Nitrosopumilaceae archaeon]